MRKNSNDMYRELLEEMGKLPPKEEEDTTEKHILKKARLSSLILIASALLLTFLLGLCFGGIVSDNSSDFWGTVFHCCDLTFLWLTAPGLISGILLFFFPGLIEFNLYAVICGHYYGTFIGGAALSEWLNFPTVLSLIVAFIATLIVMLFISNN